MQTGSIHAIHHLTHKRSVTRKTLDMIDRLAYLMGIVTVAVNMPQLVTVWTAPDIGGVSLVSWTGFFLGSAFWLVYGLLHRQKPIIVINAMLMTVQALIVAGILLR